jgi:Na+:H+ antiporter, NhaA family
MLKPRSGNIPFMVDRRSAAGRPETNPPRRWRHTIWRVSQLAIEHILLLPAGAAIAMLWVNLAGESYYQFTYPLSFAVNDVAMMFYFGLIVKEVVEATAPGGVLHSWRHALLPVIAAVGATVVPALLYMRTVEWLEEPGLKMAWPTSLGVDVAVTYLVARFIFGKTAAIPFLLLLAIVADALGFLVLGLFDPTRDLHLVRAGLVMIVAIAVAVGLRRARVKSFWPYLLLAGSLSWVALFVGGLHPALALVPIVPFLPHAARDRGFMVDARSTAQDALSRFEIWWRYPAHITLFFFGLVNAGVRFQSLEPGTWGLPIALLVGRPAGVLVAAGIAVASGMHLPQKIGWRELFVIGLIAAIGFSVGLFMANELIAPGQVRAETSMGVLLTLLAVPLALLSAKMLSVGRFGRAGM